MRNKKYNLNLNEKERQILKDMTLNGKLKAQKYQRVTPPLTADIGFNHHQMMSALNINRPYIKHICKRFVQSGMKHALNGGSRLDFSFALDKYAEPQLSAPVIDSFPVGTSIRKLFSRQNRYSDTFVSILIPIRNEAAYIDRCLDAVRLQDYPHEMMEILVADGMSDDETRQKLRTQQIKDPRVQVFENPNKNAASGLNLLTLHAQGEILIRVDGHCVIAPDYVSNCVRHIQGYAVNGVGGPMRTIGENFIAQVIALAMSSRFGVGDSSFRTETGQTKLVDTVPFPAYTRSTIERAGPYDAELVRNQDDEYNYRIRKAGGQILLAADVHSTYYSRGSLKGLWCQYFQYGFYKVRVLQKHPRQMSPRQFVPPIFIFSLFVIGLLALLTPWGFTGLIVLIGVYLLSNLAATLMTAKHKGWRYMGLLPITFATLHFSYGIGFLVGLIKFYNRWGNGLGIVPKLKQHISDGESK